MSLYHFTSFNTFLKIYESGKIWLTRCSDAKNAKDEVEALGKALHKCFIEKQDLVTRYEECFQVQGIEAIIKRFLNFRANTYMSCFTELDSKDETADLKKKVFLWEHYADNCNGVAIKFDPKFIRPDSEGPFPHVSGYDRLTETRLIRVVYSQKEFNANVSQPFTITSSNNTTPEFQTNAFKFLSRMLVHLPLDAYKPESCSNEEETRLLLHIGDDEKLHENIQYHIERNRINTGRRNTETDNYYHYHYYGEDNKRFFRNNNECAASGMPRFVTYDLVSPDGKDPAICKVFCFKNDTYHKLKDMKDKLKNVGVELL